MKNLKQLELLEDVLENSSIILPITINGKRRSEIEVAKDTSKNEIIALAKEATSKWLEEKSIIKEIYVPNKLVNLVVK
ncbi:MAG: hypothetical protein JJV94_04665 [Sulfurospirillum sp.]|nr:hypothetical protein [Sulfurospirillum sp.]